MSYNLKRSYYGLLVVPGIWRDLDDFSSGSVLLLITLPKRLPHENNAYHLFPILVASPKFSPEGKDCKSNRDRLHDYLDENGVGTVIHYPIPPHKQECYSKEAWNTPQLSLPITEQIHNEELSLPRGPSITMTDVKYVVKQIKEFE